MMLTTETVHEGQRVEVWQHPNVQPAPHQGKRGTVIAAVPSEFYRPESARMVAVDIDEYGERYTWIPVHHLIDIGDAERLHAEVLEFLRYVIERDDFSRGDLAAEAENLAYRSRVIAETPEALTHEGRRLFAGQRVILDRGPSGWRELAGIVRRVGIDDSGRVVVRMMLDEPHQFEEGRAERTRYVAAEHVRHERSAPASAYPEQVEIPPSGDPFIGVHRGQEPEYEPATTGDNPHDPRGMWPVLGTRCATLASAKRYASRHGWQSFAWYSHKMVKRGGEWVEFKGEGAA